jgi:hypothetical protein
MTMKRLTLALSCCAAAALLGCDVDVQDEGQLPDVDVQVEDGRMPDVDVTGPDVDVHTEEREVTVPDVDVDVGTQEETITVPDVDVTIPDENDNEPAGTTPE